MNKFLLVLSMIFVLSFVSVSASSTFRIVLSTGNVDINNSLMVGTKINYSDVLNPPSVPSLSGYNTTIQLKSYFDTLYYPLSNPLNFLNSTSASSLYYSLSNPLNFLNLTSIKSSGFNTTTEIQSYFDTLYYSLSNPKNYINSSSEIKSLGFNLTTELKSYFDTLYASISSGFVYSNYFNQNLNTTDSVSFASVNSSIILINNTNVGDMLMTRYNEWAYLRVLEDDQCGVQTTTGEAWYGTAIGSGTTTTSTGYTNHPCVRALRSSTTASSGYAFNIGVANLLLNGSESTEIIFMKPAISGNITNARLGFDDSVSATTSVDGVYIEILNNTAIGRVRTNNVQYNTSTNITLTFGNWYRVKVEVVNSSFANFYLYNSTTSTGGGNVALLWYNNISATLPFASGRQVGHGVEVNKVGVTTAQDLLYLDYLNVRINRELIR